MLLITITKGTSPDARRELTCYTQAYSAQTIRESAEAVTLLTWDADSLPIWEDMEHNAVTAYRTGADAMNAIMAA